MYRVIITGNPDVFSESSMARNFTRRGLIRFLSRHVNKLDCCYDYVAVSRDCGPACPVNYFYVGKKHMSDRIPTNQLIHLE